MPTIKHWRGVNQRGGSSASGSLVSLEVVLKLEMMGGLFLLPLLLFLNLLRVLQFAFGVANQTLCQVHRGGTAEESDMLL